MKLQRQKDNQELLQILTELIKQHPDLRFSQILAAFGFVKDVEVDEIGHKKFWLNEFNEEPWDILERVEEQLKKLSGT